VTEKTQGSTTIQKLYTLRQTYGYMGITAKVKARELPEYRHYTYYNYELQRL